MVEEGSALTGPSSNICKRGDLHLAVCMGSGHFFMSGGLVGVGLF